MNHDICSYCFKQKKFLMLKNEDLIPKEYPGKDEVDLNDIVKTIDYKKNHSG